MEKDVPTGASDAGDRIERRGCPADAGRGGPAMKLVMATDVGRLRERNEDAVAGDAEQGWALVADGMGGHQGGDVASAIVAREVKARIDRMMADHADDQALVAGLVTAVREAGHAVFARSENDLALRGMGSTLVVACLRGERLLVAHVGDSRAYCLHGRELRRLTSDHSLLQELLDGGMISPAEARRAPGRGILTRSLGVDFEVEVDVGWHAVGPGDLVLLCSDGLTEMVDDPDLAEILYSQNGDLDALAARLIGRANENGGRDNVSVVLLTATPSDADLRARNSCA